MPARRLRVIPKQPATCNFYLVDACFLANRVLPISVAHDQVEAGRIAQSQAWWKEIDRQVRSGKAVVYVPDICIAEAFKVLAQRYYRSLPGFPTAQAYAAARRRLRAFVRTRSRTLRSPTRSVGVHDISTTRDIIIAVDRFFEVFMKKRLNVSAPDLIILATAKYLMDFYRVPKKDLIIVTLDKPLCAGSKLLADIPSAFNPDEEPPGRVFV